MTGQVLSRPPEEHSCRPGVQIAGPAARRYAVAPRCGDAPKGTRWLCECGRVWVSLGCPPSRMPAAGQMYAPGMAPPEWRREGRFERWRRERRERRVTVDRPACMDPPVDSEAQPTSTPQTATKRGHKA